jgi:dihydrofolate reductase
VFEQPTWTFDYPFDPRMGEAIGAIMGSSEGLLLGRRTFEQFAPAWSGRSAEDDHVSGSGTLVRALIDDGLVDELHLFVFPLVLGSGRRLFPDGGAAIKLALAGTESYASGVVHLAYQLSGER